MQDDALLNAPRGSYSDIQNTSELAQDQASWIDPGSTTNEPSGKYQEPDSVQDPDPRSSIERYSLWSERIVSLLTVCSPPVFSSPVCSS